MLKQTGYIKTGDETYSHNDFSVTHNFTLKEHEGYFLTEEQLIELIGKVHDDVWASTGDGWNGEIQPLNHMTVTEESYYTNEKEQYIKELLK